MLQAESKQQSAVYTQGDLRKVPDFPSNIIIIFKRFILALILLSVSIAIELKFSLASSLHFFYGNNFNVQPFFFLLLTVISNTIL